MPWRILIGHLLLIGGMVTLIGIVVIGRPFSAVESMGTRASDPSIASFNRTEVESRQGDVLAVTEQLATPIPIITPTPVTPSPTITPELPTPTAIEEAPSPTATAEAIVPTATPEPPPPAPTPTPVPEPAKPVWLSIPKLGVNAYVEHVGVTPEGNMDVPQAWENVGWYQRGTIPGNPGNAVIGGHLDSTTGPAVFYELRYLAPGDQIFVQAEDGSELTFMVTEVISVAVTEAPMDRIFGKASEPHLNLITCDGNYDRSVGLYDRRLIVFSTLVES